MKLFNKTKVSGIPKLTDVSQEYAALLEKNANFGSGTPELKSEAGEISRRLGSRPPKEGNDQQIRVAEILGLQPPAAVDPEMKRLTELRKMIEDTELARDLLRSYIDKEKAKASAEICDSLKDRHKALVQEICAALRAVHTASLAYVEFRDALDDEGIITNSLPIVTHRLLNRPDGHPRDNQGMMAQYFSECKNAGLISESDIPVELQR